MGDIYRQGFRPFRGSFLPIGSRFLVIMQAEFLRLWKGRWNRRLILLGVLPLAITASVLVGKGVVEREVGELPIELDLLGKMLEVELALTILLAAVAGSGVLADDRQSGAFALYLSRPLTPARYLLGKGLGLASLLSLTYLAPALALMLVTPLVALPRSLGGWALDLAGAAAGAALLVVVVTVLIMALSALGRRSRYVGIAWFAIYFLSELSGKGLAEVTDQEGWRLMGLQELAARSLRWFLAPADSSPLPVLVLLLLGLAGSISLYWTVVRHHSRFLVVS